MMQTPRRRTFHAALGAGLLALALGACSSDGGGGGSGDGGLGSLLGGNDGGDGGEPVINPFETGDGGQRPSGPDAQPPGDPGDPGGPLPIGGDDGGPIVPVDDDPASDPTVPPPGESVLGRLRNDFVSENEFDLWACEVPQIAELEAVGYLYQDSQGAVVLVPLDGETQSSTFTASEASPGTVVNLYPPEAGVAETLTGFGFSGDDRFEATSDLFGTIVCERFFYEESGDGNTGDPGGPSAEPVSARLENTLGGDGQLSDVWVCQGPQLQVDANLYAFTGGQGLFAPFVENGENMESASFTYTESPPGSIAIVYANGDRETLSGIVFTADASFDATSSFDGALSCDRLALSAKRSGTTFGTFSSRRPSITSGVLVDALAGAMAELHFR